MRNISAWLGSTLFIAGLLTAAAGASRAEGLVFLSTQLRPIEEAQKTSDDHCAYIDGKSKCFEGHSTELPVETEGGEDVHAAAFDLCISQLELHALERRQRLTELLAQAHVRDGQLHRAVEHAEQRPARQHDAERHIAGPVVVDGRQLEFGDKAGAGGAVADDSAARAAERDCGPRRHQSGQRTGRPVVGHDYEAVDVQVGWFGQALRHRVRQRPVPRAAAQGGGGLEPVGIGAGVEFPRAELAQHRAGERLSEVGLWFVGLDLIAGHLIEINVTSPTCFVEITQQSGFDVASMFVDALLDAVGRK